MAVAQGYGKIVTSGSVFAYDVGDTRNSYKGKPTTNLLTTISKAGVNDSTYFKTNSGTEVKPIPNVGIRTVHYVNIYNDYNGGSGNCCPSPMHFGDFTISPSTTYTYQIIYKTSTGYDHPNYMYHYEYNGGTYVTEYGLHSTSRIQDLGDGWKHAWGTFTSNASANRFVTYLFHYEYGVWNKIEVGGIMLTQGSNIIPPTQFLDVGTTRSSTQGLLPLVGNSTLDLSNVSFDSNAQVIWDGTDDYLNNTTNFGTLSQYTIEHVSYKGSENKMSIASPAPPFFYHYGDNSWYYTHGGVAGEYYYPKSFTINGWGHWTISYDGSNVKIYRNGRFEGQQATTGTANWTNGIKIGNYTYGGYSWNGQIAVVKLYNRALTAAEVQQNYKHYKTRFNLS